MNTDVIKLKIKALLHDPPEKASILMQRRGVSHEAWARELISIVLPGDTDLTPVRKADHIASAADRYNFPKSGQRFAVDFLKRPVIRHPLSGAEINLDSLQTLDIDAVSGVVEQSLREIKARYGDDLSKIYLSLWRELPDLLKRNESGNATLGDLWDLLPADTRIPDHSIWEHRRVTAAIAGAGASPCFLLFSLGPVQDFIAASRKTRDLWAGSSLLSYLAWQAMRGVCERIGPDAIIFPDLYKQPQVDRWLEERGLSLFEPGKPPMSPSLPNRFLAIVPDDMADTLAQQAREAVICELKRVGHFARQRLGSYDWDDMWERQLSGFVECYWAVLPWPETLDGFSEMYPHFLGRDDEKADRILEAFKRGQFKPNIGVVYGRLYGLTERLTGSRKSLRDFQALTEPGYRCSLIPTLAAAHPEEVTEPSQIRTFWHALAERSKHRIRPDERLSPVAAAKRFCPEYLQQEKNFKTDIIRFPSTPTIATADFMLDVIGALKSKPDSGLLEAVRTFTGAVQTLRNKLGDAADDHPLPRLYRACRDSNVEIRCVAEQWCGQVGGQWLFEDTYDTTALQDEFQVHEIKAAEGDRQRALEALRRLLRLTTERNIDRPSKYYAMLKLDGDSMGKWLSGMKAAPFREALHPDVCAALREHPEWGAMLHSDHNLPRPQSPSQHLAISRALRNFSLELVRDILERRYPGKLVYAGGDDVLAFVSFKQGLPALRALRAAFSGSLDDEGNADWKQDSGFVLSPRGKKRTLMTMGNKATASAGLVFAHYSQSLQQVMAEARETEEYAKGEEGKNAFAIAVMKRSGERVLSRAKWFYEEGRFDTIEALETYAGLIRDKLVSTASIVYMQKEQAGLEGVPKEAQCLELERVYFRHASSKQGEVKQRIKRGWQKIASLMQYCTLDQTIGLLDVAQFIGKGGAR